MRERPELDLYAVLVSTQNLRSINAHKKLGMESVGKFSFDNNDYLILVLPSINVKVKIDEVMTMPQLVFQKLDIAFIALKLRRSSIIIIKIIS